MTKIANIVARCAENFGEPIQLVIDEYGTLPLWTLLESFEEFAGENVVAWSAFTDQELTADLGFLLDKEGFTE